MDDENHVPRPPTTRPPGAPLMLASVVLIDAALRVHRESDVDATFEFGVCAEEHVYAKEVFHLYHHFEDLVTAAPSVRWSGVEIP